MSFVACVIYFVLTVVIPLKQTVTAIRENKETKLWAIYWAIYSFIGAIVWMMPFLDKYSSTYLAHYGRLGDI